jgi:UDP-N-acetylglucosamine:LPS N-acetylglucosamine transferase
VPTIRYGLATTRYLDFLYFQAGGGHRSAALALQSVLASQHPEWEVRLVDAQQVLDPIDILRKVTGIRTEDIYNKMLAKGWTLKSEYLLPVLHGLIRVLHREQVKMFRNVWAQRRPDLVVSVIPNLNRSLFESLQAVHPGVPYITILTDLADYPPHFWIEKQAQYFICGTPRAVEQARELGHPPERIFLTSGMILRPLFYEAAPVDVAAERRRLGLDPHLPTALIMFGGEGSAKMTAIAKRLGRCELDLQMIFICGKNAKLRAKLERLETRNLKFVEGFTSQVPYYMRLADFFIGKAGPGSISEAIHMGLPVIVERNAWTLPQEVFNTHWVAEQGVGIAVKNFNNIVPVARGMLSGGSLASMREATARIHNRAVFEIPEMLDRVMAMAGAPVER